MKRLIPSSVAWTLALICGAGCSSPGAASSGSGSAATSSSAPAATSSPDGLKVGDAAPALTLKLQDGKEVDLAAQKGKYVLVYFYPKDDTPGCTTEANGIKASWEKFKAAGIDVYGVSTQDAASHAAFIEKYELPFPLVVDGESVAKAFKVPLKNGMAARQSFLIGKDGRIVSIWPKVDPSQHADEVLAAAKS